MTGCGNALGIICGALLLVGPATGAGGSSPGYRTADGAIRIVGYNDMAEMLVAATRRITAAHPDLRFDLELKSTRSAPAALIAGTSLLAPMGAELSAEERAAFRAAWGSDPVAVRIAHDSLDPGALSSPTGLLVARDNPLRRIDIGAARRLFAPKAGERPVVTWGDLGATRQWAARPIHPVGLAADTAIGNFMLHGPLRGTTYSGALSAKRQSRDVAAAVAADADAIGIANLNHAQGKVRALAIVDDAGVTRPSNRSGIRSGSYPFDRFLLVYARRESDGAIAPAARIVLAALLSRSGQTAIAGQKLRYIPLNPRERAVEQLKLDKMDDYQ